MQRDFRINSIKGSVKSLARVILKDSLELDSLEEAKKIILEISNYKKQEIFMLENIVNSGLKYTYPEKELKFSMDFVLKRGKIEPDFYLNELLLKHPFKGDGGGIITIIGLLLYLSAVYIQRQKIILLDETMKMVDLEASTRFLEFLKRFSEEKNIQILLISHKKYDYRTDKLTNKINIMRMED